MEPLIRPGDTSSEVADVQARLRALGFDVLDEPGRFATGTRDAVRAFQQSRGILIDGIVGPNTWAELVEASWHLGDRTLYLRRPLMRGDDVLMLQARMNALGFDPGREDGIFGGNTDAAVRAFQKEYGVPEDGIWGQRSHAALLGLRIDRPGAAGLREQLRRARPGGIAAALVMIDPGHGADDPGCTGPGGGREADILWDMAVRLAAALTQRGAQARFTRTENENPGPTQRARRANEVGADLFLSLHLNTHEHPTARGACTYYFGSSLAGEALADLIQREMVGLGALDCRTHPRSYPVLRETRMPAVLVEPAFVTNPDDEEWIRDPGRRTQLAEGIATALERYYAEAGS